MHERLPLDRVRDALSAWRELDPTSAHIEAIPPGATADVFLVTQGSDRWVAKYAYDFRDYFEGGLRASAALQGRVPFDIGTPMLAADGGYTVVVEWPDGDAHPLALMHHVDGRVVDAGDDGAVELLGDVCGRVHRALLDIDPATINVPTHSHPVPPIADTWDLGEHAWLNEVYRDLGAIAAELDSNLRHAVGVWDGPDIRVDGERIGLIDFGHTAWHPVVYVVANRSLIAAYTDRGRLDRFLATVECHLPLTATEHDALDLYRLVNATIYARWATTQATEATQRWAEQLFDVLRTDLPRVGLRAG